MANMIQGDLFVPANLIICQKVLKSEDSLHKQGLVDSQMKIDMLARDVS